MGRPTGPIRKYTVHCIWPAFPGAWREAVALADEKTARASVEALLRMHYSVQLTITFQKPNTLRTHIAAYVTAQWDRYGGLVYSHHGDMSEFMPAWTLGQEEKEKVDGRELPRQRRRDRRVAS